MLAVKLQKLQAPNTLQICSQGYCTKGNSTTIHLKRCLQNDHSLDDSFTCQQAAIASNSTIIAHAGKACLLYVLPVQTLTYNTVNCLEVKLFEVILLVVKALQVSVQLLHST